MIQPVILCGGSGTRLWPLSRPERPKPFLPLLGKRSLFQQTLDRIGDPNRFELPVVVCGASHVDLVATQAGRHETIVEPAARNTAPAIALAAALAPHEALLLVCPSDHYIADTPAFLEAIERAAPVARKGRLVCFGIEPDRAETGYGYIERGAPLEEVHEVARFVEKPAFETAQAFLGNSDFVWNGGIFLFSAGRYLEELERNRPAMARAVERAVAEGCRDGTRFHPGREAFEAIETESVDYAVMENTDQAAVVSCDMGWSDIGDWSALMKARKQAGLDLLAVGTRTVDTHAVMTLSDGPRISLVGVDNAIVVVDGDEVLVVSSGAAQDLRKLDTIEGG